MKTNKNIIAFFLFLFICSFSLLAGAIEREQEGVQTFLSLEKTVMLHYLQGKSFFKEGNYELATIHRDKAAELGFNVSPKK